MAGKKFSMRLCPKTEAVLAAVPLERRSAYVREAILFYHDQGILLRRIEEKVDWVVAVLGEGVIVATVPAQKTEDRGDNADMEAYLFSGQNDIFDIQK